ncbi:MAG: hypothetical protein JW384_03416 [Nitrosomonadaceae bacterium]|nr:hypothetical protein [Nitrosomonadaceae bacterium]
MNCRVCTSILPAPFIDLGKQPLANNLTKVPVSDIERYPLAMARCQRCLTVQLTYSVPPKELFSHYLYQPGFSPTFHAHFEAMASKLAQLVDLKDDDLVVDIGSNDGTLLSKFKQHTSKIIGVEPAKNLATQANAAGIETLNEFVSANTVTRITQQFGQARIVTATNVFAHTPDILNMAESIAAIMADDGIFVFEVVDLLQMLKQGTFDMIYHEHYFAWDISSLRFLLGMVGLEIFDFEPVAMHGGSLRVYAQRQGGKHPQNDTVLLPRLLQELIDCSEKSFTLFAERAKQVQSTLRALIQHNSPVIGYGSPAKATVLISYCQLTGYDMPYIVDDSPLKQGLYIPGTSIQIVKRDFLDQKYNAVVCWPWNIVDDILPKLTGLADNAIIPMPDVRTVSLVS